METYFLFTDDATGQTTTNQDLKDLFAFKADILLIKLQNKREEIDGKSQVAEKVLDDTIKMQETFCFFAKTFTKMPLNKSNALAMIYMSMHQSETFKNCAEALKHNIR